MQQAECRDELLALLHVHGGNWLELTKTRLAIGRYVRDMLDRWAERYHSLGGLPDPAMEEFRAIARAYGTLIARDCLLDEIFPTRERRM